jgi:hypothetical protein
VHTKMLLGAVKGENSVKSTQRLVTRHGHERSAELLSMTEMPPHERMNTCDPPDGLPIYRQQSKLLNRLLISSKKQQRLDVRNHTKSEIFLRDLFCS